MSASVDHILVGQAILEALGVPQEAIRMTSGFVLTMGVHDGIQLELKQFFWGPDSSVAPLEQIKSYEVRLIARDEVTS